MPTQRSGRSREAHLKVRKESGVPPRGPGGIERSTQGFENGWEAHP